MSDLQNPLFDEEKEFLERKKLEYERALRGDVDLIKEQSVKVGKVALVGTGLVGGLWLITKAIKGISGGSKKSKKSKHYAQTGDDRADYEPDSYDDGFGFEDEYFTAGNGKRYKSVIHRKSAADSARAFMEQEQERESDYRQEQGHESDDLGFGSKATAYSTAPSNQFDEGHSDNDENDYRESSPFDTEEFEDDPFQNLPYDDSRRLPMSRAFDGEDEDAPRDYRAKPRSGNTVGNVLQAFLKTDTGKMLVAQAAAVALAMVTKKVSEFFPSDKNPDLAASPGSVPAETGFAPVVSLASPDSPDASTHTSSI